MEIQGTIYKCLEKRSGTSERGNWASQEFLLEYSKFDGYNRLLFTVFGEDRLNRFNIKEGQKVNVCFDVKAREYNGKWYNDVTAWDVRPVTADGNLQTAGPSEQKGGEPDF